MTFRIIEERKTLSNTSKFFIQKKHGFFIFTWWKKLKILVSILNVIILWNLKHMKMVKIISII